MTMQVYPTLPGLTYPVLKSADFDTLIQSAPNKYEVRIAQTVNPQWHWELVYDFLRDFLLPGFTVTELRTLLDFFLYQGGQAGEFLFLDPDDNYVGPAMNGTSPNTPLAQLQLVQDASGNFYSPLQRTLGGLFYEDITDLNTNTGAGGSTPAFYANGIPQRGVDYTIQGPGLALPTASYMGLYVAWTNVWIANLFYSAGQTIFDSHGHVQKATVSAAAGPTVPTWNDSGGTTTDGAQAWQDLGPAVITAQFNFYFRVRFESDSRDMEKFANQFWTIGGSETKNGSGYVKLMQARPNPL